MNIYLVRHGECSIKKGCYLGSGSNISINNLGVNQIEKISKKLKSQIESNKTYLYSSSLNRAVESATIIKNTLGLDNIITDPRLNELSFGLWEGLTYDDIMAQWAEVATIWYNNPFHITPPEAEPFLDFYNRVELFIDELLQNQDDVVIVTHGGVIQIMLTILNGDYIDNRWSYNLGRGEFKRISIGKDFLYISRVSNDSPYLTEFWDLIIKEWGDVEFVLDPKPLLAFKENKLVGGLSFIQYKNPLKDGNALWINTLYIKKNNRGKGIASKLINKAVDLLHGYNIDELFVYSDKPKLYIKQDWKIIETNKDHFVLKKSIPNN